MQRTEFGQDIPKSGGNFIRVKEKGDTVTFRLAQPPVHTGKHFLTNEDGSWNVVTCARINDNETCEYCEAYFNVMAEAKAAEAQGDKEAATALKEEARKGGKQVAIQFFYPVLNRDTGTFGILQTTYGIKKTIDDKYNNGVKVLERDMVLTNTGKPAAARYALDVVDSADMKPLTPEEEEEFEKAKEFDMLKINAGGNQDVDIVKEAEKVFNPDDIPDNLDE